MSLARIISEAAEAHERDGIINRHEAINNALPRVLADLELTTTCVRAHVSRMIATNARSRQRSAAEEGFGQGSIFGLRDVHVVDDGEGNIKETRALSRIEFAALIRVRDKQINDDRAYLDKLQTAAAKTALLWDRHPNWSWGQIEDAYARQQARAA